MSARPQKCSDHCPGRAFSREGYSEKGFKVRSDGLCNPSSIAGSCSNVFLKSLMAFVVFCGGVCICIPLTQSRASTLSANFQGYACGPFHPIPDTTKEAFVVGQHNYLLTARSETPNFLRCDNCPVIIQTRNWVVYHNHFVTDTSIAIERCQKER